MLNINVLPVVVFFPLFTEIKRFASFANNVPWGGKVEQTKTNRRWEKGVFHLEHFRKITL